MKLFLSKLMIIIIPVGALLVTMEILNRKNDHSSTAIQKKIILDHSNDLEGLVFGSSYMWCSIQPQYLDRRVGSLALIGSAPRVDYLIFTYAKQVSKPKFILLDGSKSYFMNYKSSDFIKSSNLSYYFPGMESRELADFFLTEIPLSQHFPMKNPLKYNQWGYYTEIPMEQDLFKELNYQDSLISNHPRTKSLFTDFKGIKRANKTLSNLDFCRKIIQECLAEEIKVIFISPPKYHLFNQFIDELHLTEREAFMDEIVDNQRVFFLNYERHNEKNPKLFFNVNHLNLEGSQVFSQELNKDLNNILNE